MEKEGVGEGVAIGRYCIGVSKNNYIKSLDILNGVSPVNMNLTWWSIADKFPQHIKGCEIMAKLVCHASVLRADNFKYKSLPGTAQMCDVCGCFEVEDARHFVLRCSYFACERDTMLREIDRICESAGTVTVVDNIDMLFTMLGRLHDGLSNDQMMRIWFVILSTVPAMYRKNMRHKRGIG